MSGIYEIRNLLNSHIYIGSSISIEKRWYHHIYTLDKKTHKNRYLQRAWNKYGESNFEFNILEECDTVEEILLSLEQKYINDLNPEYNILLVAERPKRCKRTKEFRRKQSLAKKGKPFKYRSEETERLSKINKSKGALNSSRVKNMRKPVIMLDKNTSRELKEFSSILEAAYFLGRRNKQVNIGWAANGKRKTACGYKWKFKNKCHAVSKH